MTRRVVFELPDDATDTQCGTCPAIAHNEEGGTYCPYGELRYPDNEKGTEPPNRHILCYVSELAMKDVDGNAKFARFVRGEMRRRTPLELLEAMDTYIAQEKP